MSGEPLPLVDRLRNTQKFPSLYPLHAPDMCCEAANEIDRLKAIILDRNEAIEVFQRITEENNEKLSEMYHALTSTGQTLVTISAHVVNCVNRIEEARKKR